MKFNLCLTFVFSLPMLLPAFASANNLRQITSRDGLSNSSVYCLYQDDEHFLWIGTFDGLNKYDGRNINIYKPDINNQYSLSSNVIRKITETEGDYLWISTKWGLNKLSQKENIIVEYHDEFKEDSHIAKDNKGNLFVLQKPGFLSIYSKKGKTFIDIPVNQDITITNVTGLFIDANDTIWINHNGVFERYHVSDEDTLITRLSDYSHSNRIIFAAFDSGRLLFVDDSGDLYSINPQKTVFIRNISQLLEESGEISSIIYDYNDILIGFKTNGLVRLQAQDYYKIERIEINCGVFSLLKDAQQDITWIGTDGQGVYVWTKDDYTFENITLSQLPVKKQRPVRAIYTDNQNNMWLGTKDNGVIRIKNYHERQEFSAKNITHYTTDNGLQNNGVFAFAYSTAHNVLWIGSDGPGLNYFSFQDNKIYSLQTYTKLNVTYVHSLFESDDSTLWAGSGSNLLKLSLEKTGNQLKVKSSRRFSFNLKNNQTYNQIYSLLQESDSIVWIGVRGNGIIRFNMKNESYKIISFEQNSIAPMNDILCIYQDEDNVLWLGTSYGLIRFVMFRDGHYEYKNYNENEGLPNNTVHGILEAPEGKLWLSSNKGITLFDPASETFRNFNHKTGLKTIEFSDNAYYRDKRKAICFFGGVDGLVGIRKEEIEKRRFIPKIYFTKIRVFNQDYIISDFEKQRNNETYIELKNKQNVFSVSFVAVDFINGANCSYSYKLENFSDVWMETYSNEAQFTNISPGSYTLHVRYNDDTDSFSKQTGIIKIVILPPWYLSIYAKIIYILLFISIIYGIYSYIRMKYEKRKRKIDRQLQQKYKEEIYEGKLRFFTNITHEFSTPLTLIYGPCERLIKNSSIDASAKKYVQIIKSNAERLNSLIQEIIDFRRMETGNKICRFELTDISKLTQEIADSFKELAEQNNILFTADISPDIQWNTDTSCYTKIVSNLISNAFKYTPEKGRINISIERDGEILILKVYNTGMGISEENIPLIFNRYSILDNVKENSIRGLSSRNGLGLAICNSLTELLKGAIRVESKVNEYAEFIVTLPRPDTVQDRLQPVLPSRINLPDISSVQEPVKIVPETLSQNKEHILIVDDNKELLWFLKDILSDEYIVHTAENGKEGLEALKKENPDLIITDIMMPEIDGITLTKQIKSNKHTMHIPLVILSARNSNEEKIEGLESGADAYVPKPFNTEYLKVVVRRAIKNRKNMEQYYNSSASAYKFSDGQLLQTEDKDFIMQIVDIVMENIDNSEFSTENLADSMKTSVRNLYRKFKELNQPTPNDFIKEIRLKTAARMIITTTLTIQEIMYKTGFNNRSHFYREFSKRYEKTPKEYRDSNRIMDSAL